MRRCKRLTEEQVTDALTSAFVDKIEAFERRTGHRFLETLPSEMRTEIDAARIRHSERRRSGKLG